MKNQKYRKILADRVKILHKQHGLTIEQLAYQSDISKGGLSEIERNMKEPRAYTILKICAGLGITMKDFLILKKSILLKTCYKNNN